MSPGRSYKGLDTGPLSTQEPTDDKLAPPLQHVAERLNLVFAYFFFELEFEGDEDLRDPNWRNGRNWRLQTIRNATINSSLIAIRDLDDFLTPRDKYRRTKKDDLKASDFGYTKTSRFLSASERQDINKRIAHATTVAITRQDVIWDIWELASKAVAQTLAFLAWVRDHYGVSHLTLYTAAVATHRVTEDIYQQLSAEVAERRNNKTQR